MRQQVAGPGDRRRRGLVAGGHERDQLIAEIGLRQRRAILVARPHQQREHVDPLLERGIATRAVDVREQQLVHAIESRVRRPREQVPPGALPQRGR